MNAVQEYRRAFRRALHCGSPLKKRLLRQLDDITIHATFKFDGSGVKVISKEIVQCSTYDGWKFSQTGFTSSGGTVTLSGKLSKGLSSKSISLSLSCDKNGNLS